MRGRNRPLDQTEPLRQTPYLPDGCCRGPGRATCTSWKGGRTVHRPRLKVLGGRPGDPGVGSGPELHMAELRLSRDGLVEAVMALKNVPEAGWMSPRKPRRLASMERRRRPSGPADARAA